ncbi:uncharacterized protein ARMOST_22585 [Armillaria ostoyae]|uniref:Uncharacterized protein n=1 Tax=Armillaria ostoyae TaxID=47428 RepID=A0A284SDB1_ARMOS|nr:uncharacterized protein ARMOST_22585 [Armillaria ostoyae]
MVNVESEELIKQVNVRLDHKTTELSPPLAHSKFLSGLRPSFNSDIVDLTRIYGTTILKSSYPTLPTTNSKQKPDMDSIFTLFRLQDTTAVFCPYVQGFCGEHQSQHPDVQQLAGSGYVSIDGTVKPSRNMYPLSSRMTRASSFGRSRTISAPVAVPSQPIAGPSRPRLASGPIHPLAFHTAVSNNEKKILRDLIEGRGVSALDWIGLFDRCTSCAGDQYFLSSVLRNISRQSIAKISSEVIVGV